MASDIQIIDLITCAYGDLCLQVIALLLADLSQSGLQDGQSRCFVLVLGPLVLTRHYQAYTTGNRITHIGDSGIDFLTP